MGSVPWVLLLACIVFVHTPGTVGFYPPSASPNFLSSSAFPTRRVCLNPNGHTNSYKSTRCLPQASSGSSDGPKQDDKKPKEEEFTVTWEHEDGTTDTTKAIKLVDKSGPNVPPQDKEKEDSKPPSLMAKVANSFKNFFGGEKLDRKKLASLGGSALLSYGWISNISYSICLIAAWVIHARRTGLTPIDPGQWPQFLVVYGGFWMMQNFIRPFRFALSVAASPFFDRLVNFIQTKASDMTRRSIGKPSAFGITVFLVNVLGTFAFLGLGLFLATLCAGVPMVPLSWRTGLAA